MKYYDMNFTMGIGGHIAPPVIDRHRRQTGESLQ